MAFDKSMLLTCLAVVLVLVTGVTIAVTGDLSDNIKKSGLEVGDYIETEMIETENGEVIYSDVSRNVITAIEIEDRKEVIYYDIIVDGENYGEIETNAESFLTLLIYFWLVFFLCMQFVLQSILVCEFEQQNSFAQRRFPLW